MLKRFFQWLWCPGPCKWETIEKESVYESSDYNMPYKKIYVLRCMTCGEIKQKDIW